MFSIELKWSARNVWGNLGSIQLCLRNPDGTNDDADADADGDDDDAAAVADADEIGTHSHEGEPMLF